MDTEILNGLMAIGATVVAFAGARVGLPGRVLWIAYVDRRVKVISALLNEHRDRLSPMETAGLEKEVSYLVHEVLETSGNIQVQQMQEWSRQSPLRRLFVLPRPKSTIGWVLTCMTYIYLVAGVIYFGNVVMFGVEAAIDTNKSNYEALLVVLAGFSGSALLFTFLRKLSLIVARRDVGLWVNEKAADS